MNYLGLNTGKAAFVGIVDDLGTVNNWQGAAPNNACIAIDSTRVLQVNREGGGDINARVVTMNGDGSQSYGSNLLVQAASGNGHIAICKLTSTSFVLVSPVGNTNHNIFALSVSGTSVLLDDSDTINGGTTGNVFYVGCARLTDTKALIYFNRGFDGKLVLNTTTISGGSITKGANVIDVTSQFTGGGFFSTQVQELEDNKVVLIGDASNKIGVAVVTNSGATPSLDSYDGDIINSGGNNSSPTLALLNTDEILMCYKNAAGNNTSTTNNIDGVVLSVSGSVVAKNTIFNDITADAHQVAMGLVAPTSNKVVLLFGNITDSKTFTKVLNVSGFDITTDERQTDIGVAPPGSTHNTFNNIAMINTRDISMTINGSTLGAVLK